MSIRRFFGWVPILATNMLFHLVVLVTTIFILLELQYGDAAVRLGAESMRIAVFYVLAALTALPALRSFWLRQWSPAHIVSMAVCALATMIAVHATWVPLKRYVAMPEWVPAEPITTAIIIGISIAGIGYMVPVSRHRFISVAPGVASWASIFVTGFLAGGIAVAFFLSGLSF